MSTKTPASPSPEESSKPDAAQNSGDVASDSTEKKPVENSTSTGKESGESPPIKKPATPKVPGRWRRRTIWALIILICLSIIGRGVLPLALPTVMRRVAGIFGLTCDYDRLELNLVSGDAGIWGLQFKPAEGGSAILQADYCHGNVSVLNLLRGKLNVWRVEADGVEVNIDRNPDGHIPLLDRFIAATSSTSKTAPAKPTPVAPSPAAGGAPSAPVDLTSPLRVDALRLTHIHVHVHDRGITPELDTELAMDLRLSDLGSTTNPVKFEMNMSADPMLDSLKVTGEGTSGGKNLDAKLHVVAHGVRLKPAAAYLSPFGIVPVAEGLTFTADGRVITAGAPNGAEGFTGSIAFDNLSTTADLDKALGLDHLKIDAGVIDTKSIHLNSIILTGARAQAARAADGNLRVAGIEYDPRLVAKTAPPPMTVPSTPAAPLPPILTALLAEHISVAEVALKDARLDLNDQGIAPAVNLSIIVDELSAKSIDHDPKNLNTTVTLGGSIHAPGLVRDISLDGHATPFADNKTFAVNVNATGIKPDAIKSYLDPIGIESTLKDGQFHAAIDATLSIGDTITAGLNVTRCEFSDGSPLLSLSNVALSNVTFDTKTARVSVGDFELAGPGVSVLRDPTGQLIAFGFRTKPPVATAMNKTSVAPAPALAKAATTAPAVPAASGPTVASLPNITIEKFGWKDIHLDLEDQTVSRQLKFRCRISASKLPTSPPI